MDKKKDQTVADGKGIRQSRWTRDGEGMYHYRGVCPFNNATCRLKNYIEGRRSSRRVEHGSR